MKAGQIKGLALVLAAALPGAAAAQGYYLKGNVKAQAVTSFPGPSLIDQNSNSVSWVNLPPALQPNAIQASASIGNGGSATGKFLGSVGSLKAYAIAESPYGVNAAGTTVFSGGANAQAEGSFYDTVVVGGAGLALGTPVSYTINLSISGSVSPEIYLPGGPGADAVARMEMFDLQGLGGKTFNWSIKNQATGTYSLTVATEVGHTLGITGLLYVSAGMSTQVEVTRSVVADFYHSALYTLTPSVAGLNTTGVSGHNFLAPVPESSTAGLMALGLAAFGLARRRFVREGAR
jgi:hypothetical protein